MKIMHRISAAGIGLCLSIGLFTAAAQASAVRIDFTLSDIFIGEGTALDEAAGSGSFIVDTSSPTLVTVAGTSGIVETRWNIQGSSIQIEGLAFPSVLPDQEFIVTDFPDPGEDEVFTFFQLSPPDTPADIDQIIFFLLFEGMELDGADFPTAAALNAAGVMEAGIFVFNGNGGDIDVVEYSTISVTFTDVTTVPVPAALPLLAMALGGLGFFRWRKLAAV